MEEEIRDVKTGVCTKEDVIQYTINILAGISIPAILLAEISIPAILTKSIGIPISNALDNLNVLRQMLEAEKKANEENKDEDTGELDIVPIGQAEESQEA